MSALDKFLIKAVQQGNLDDASEYLAEHANPNARDTNGSTAIHLAASAGNEDMVKLLLAHKANPNIDDDDGVMPLTAALEHMHLAIADILLKDGAKPNLPAGDLKMTVLHAAINMDMKDGKTERVLFLLERGADANGAPNANGLTPYQQAKKYTAQFPQAQAIVDAMARYAETQEQLAARKLAEFIAAEVSVMHTGTNEAPRVKTVRFGAPKGPR